MFQPRQHNLLTRLLDLARQKHFIQYRIHLSHTTIPVSETYHAHKGPPNQTKPNHTTPTL